MTLRLVMLGRTRRSELRALLDDYLGRLQKYCTVTVHELRSPRALDRLGLERGAVRVLLDADGRTFSSVQFAQWLANQRDRGVREVVFLCGAAEGVPPDWQQAADMRLSLSPLTLPHELARVVLAEQLYRAWTWLAGHPYPK